MAHKTTVISHTLLMRCLREAIARYWRNNHFKTPHHLWVQLAVGLTCSTPKLIQANRELSKVLIICQLKVLSYVLWQPVEETTVWPVWMASREWSEHRCHGSSLELRELIQYRLSLTPIVCIPPIGDHFLEIIAIKAVIKSRAGDGLHISGRLQRLFKSVNTSSDTIHHKLVDSDRLLGKASPPVL